MSRLDGVDISGWDEGISIPDVEADFIIVKSTEGVQGTRYNPSYRQMADAVLATNRLLGFYHYANGGDPIAEADCFYDSIADYRGRAIACLDWEGQGNPTFETGRDVEWCEAFLDRIAERFGGTPLLYTGKYTCLGYDWSGVAAKYPLWGAMYATDDPTYGYQSDPWQTSEPWGAWGGVPLIHQYSGNLVLERNGGIAAFDGNVFYGTREGWMRLCGGEAPERVGPTTRRIDCAERAALIHFDMVEDDRNGYSQAPVRWGGDYGEDKVVELPGGSVTYPLGSYDCSSSVCRAWRLALVGSPYEGALDDATYTGNMREAFLASGLFYADRTPARRGDVYLHDGRHTAMCQDGGMGDGPFGYDCLSHFRHNEWGGIEGGEVGDQTGEEALVQPFYESPWLTTLHYNHKADWDEQIGPVVVQMPGEPVNNSDLWYRVHVEDFGWLEPVHDGQVAGTTGMAKRMEAIKITPPEDWELYVKLHMQDYGWVTYEGIRRGESSGEGSSPTDPIMGTVGEGRRIEDVIIGVSKRPAGDTRKLRFCVHQQDAGWKAWTEEGNASGTDGMSIRLEAIRIAIW